MYAFAKSDLGVFQAGGAYDSTNRASGTFTAPQRGLYLIKYKEDFGYTAKNIVRNGNETLCGHDNENTGKLILSI